jgi:molecular chaperone DnaJ
MNVELERDLYGVLGIAPTVEAQEVRRAFRTLAHRLHPDVAGPHSAPPRFQAVVEAYRVLGDGEERRHYDAQRATRGPAPAAPLALLGSLSLDDFVAPASEHARMGERLARNFTGRHVPKSEHLEPLELDLVLSVDEAARGGVLRLGVPTFTRCAQCAGTGHDWLFSCFGCQGQGVVEVEEPVSVHIPPGVASGTHFLVPLRHLGIQNVYLDLAVHVRS